MNKKIIIWAVILILIACVGFITGKIVDSKNNSTKLSINETTQNLVNVSEEDITDACIDEWDDYDDYVQEQIEEASNDVVKDNTHYLLKDIGGYIEVYYLDEKGEEYLYKKTAIATDYLSPEDIDDLQVGIEVVGTESLNKMLEDFE